MSGILNNITIADRDLQKVEDFRKRQNTSVLVILFTDLQDSTKLREETGDVEFEKILKEHDSTVIPLVGKFNGEYIKSIGDGIMAVFSEPSSAILYSMEIQKAFLRHRDIRIKIGMDMGQVSMEDANGVNKDVFGRFVNRAARITGLAKGGHILLSDNVQDSASGWVDKTLISWKNHGEHKVKGVERPIRVWESFNANTTSPMAISETGDAEPGKDTPSVTSGFKRFSFTSIVLLIVGILIIYFSVMRIMEFRMNILNNALFRASKENNIMEAQNALARGADIEAVTPDEERDTPLILAAQEGNLKIVSFLLDNGANVENTDIHKQTALLVACDRGHLDVVRTLLDFRADVNRGNFENNKPIIVASLNGHREIASLLLQKGAEVNAQDDGGYSALHGASSMNHADTAETLIDNGADVNLKNNEGFTPLHLASQKGYGEMTEFLLRRGANPDELTAAGDTPSGLAEAEGHSDIVELLEEFRK